MCDIFKDTATCAILLVPKIKINYSAF